MTSSPTKTNSHWIEVGLGLGAWGWGVGARSGIGFHLDARQITAVLGDSDTVPEPHTANVERPQVLGL